MTASPEASDPPPDAAAAPPDPAPSEPAGPDAPPPSPPSTLRSRLISVAKLAVAVGLITALFATGKIDASALGNLDRTALPWIAAAIGCIGVVLVCASIRWRLLLRGQGVLLGAGDAYRLTLTGHFFNLMLFGAVGGDLIKGFYIAKAARARSRTPEAVTSVFLDRIIGLAALTAIAGVATFVIPNEIAERKEIVPILWSVLAVNAVLVLGVVFIAIGWFPRILPETPQRMVDAVMRLRRRGSGGISAFLISVACHVLSISAIYSLGRAFGEEGIAFGSYFFLCPVALFANALPLTPSGIGVGEAAFETLFAWAAGTPDSLGGEICLLLRLVQLVWSAIGGLIYAFALGTPTVELAEEEGEKEKEAEGSGLGSS